jgi:hypothetical protein
MSARGLKEGSRQSDINKVGFYPFRGPDASLHASRILPEKSARLGKLRLAVITTESQEVNLSRLLKALQSPTA